MDRSDVLIVYRKTMVSRMMTKLIGIKEIIEFLGVRRSTVYSWIHAREIPHYKIGRLIKFNIHEIENWIESRKVRVTT